MMICPVCGKELPDTVRKCPHCGCGLRPGRERPGRLLRPLLCAAAGVFALTAGLWLGTLLGRSPALPPAGTDGPALSGTTGPVDLPATRPTPPPETVPPKTDPPAPPLPTGPLLTEPPTEPPVLWDSVLRTYSRHNDLFIQYIYDDLGRIDFVVSGSDNHSDALSVYWLPSYDSAGRFAGFHMNTNDQSDGYGPGTDFTGLVRYSPDGRTVTVLLYYGSNLLRTFRFYYDSTGRVLTRATCSAGSEPMYTLDLFYDPSSGGLARIAVESNAPNSPSYETAYIYDGGVLTGYTYTAGGVTRNCVYGRTADGSAAMISAPDGTISCSLRPCALSPEMVRQYRLQLLLMKIMGLDPMPILPPEEPWPAPGV